MKCFQACAFFVIIFATLVLSSCNTNKGSSNPVFHNTEENADELSPVEFLSDWLEESDVITLQAFLNNGYPELIDTEFSISSDDTLLFCCSFKEQIDEYSVAKLTSVLSKQLSSLEPSFEELLNQYYNETNGLLKNIEIQYLNADNSIMYSQIFSYTNQ